MNRVLIYSLVFLLCICCQSLDKPVPPQKLIPEDRMVEILTDMAFIMAAKNSERKFFEEKNINPESIILKKYGIDSAMFTQNNIWYSNHIDSYKAIITKVQTNLSEKQDLYEKLKIKEDSIQAIKDSIQKRKEDSLKFKGRPNRPGPSRKTSKKRNKIIPDPKKS